VPRYPWHELPPAVRAEVENRTDPIVQVTPVETGVICDVAVILGTSTGRVFCKAIAADIPWAGCIATRPG
jgi:hypothetical protein